MRTILLLLASQIACGAGISAEQFRCPGHEVKLSSYYGFCAGTTAEEQLYAADEIDRVWGFAMHAVMIDYNIPCDPNNRPPRVRGFTAIRFVDETEPGAERSSVPGMHRAGWTLIDERQRLVTIVRGRYENSAVIAHEMGHSWGIRQHVGTGVMQASSPGYRVTYSDFAALCKGFDE